MPLKLPGLVLVGPTVQLNAAHILVSDPNMHVTRLEPVLSGVDDKTELTLYRHGGHTMVLEQGSAQCTCAVSTKYHLTILAI